METISSNWFKISTGEPVIARNGDDTFWTYTIFSHKLSDNDFPFVTVSGKFKECIPYVDNENLVGTKNSPKNNSYEKIDIKDIFGEKVKGVTNREIPVEGIVIGYNEKNRNTPYLVRTTKCQGYPTNGVMFWCKEIICI